MNKAVIVNVRATAYDNLRDHPCHPPHCRQRGSEQEEDHGHVPPGAEMAAAVVNKAVIVNVRATAHDHLRHLITLATPLTIDRGGPKKRRITFKLVFPPRYHLRLSHVLYRLPPMLLSRVIKKKNRQYRAAQQARI